MINWFFKFVFVKGIIGVVDNIFFIFVY